MNYAAEDKKVDSDLSVAYSDWNYMIYSATDSYHSQIVLGSSRWYQKGETDLYFYIAVYF